jgi:DNA helicase-2/ATP-dependent DNA helicase PcrA
LVKFLGAPFAQLEAYAAYVRQEAAFDTHQGVKGREFQRVMVVMDDEQSKGFMFKYEKLFGVDPESKTDLENRRQGKDTAIDRVRRLFYVTCSRSMNSLALVAYSSNPTQVRQYAINQGWFAPEEIEVLGGA